MLRTLAILGILAVVVAAAFGAAATLDLNGGALQVGSDTDLRCDTDGVDVDGWGLETDTGLVNFVRIHNIDPACSGNMLKVEITDDGVQVAEGSVEPIPVDGATGDNDGDSGDVGVKITFAPAYSAADITDIEVFIEGPYAP